MGTEVRCEALRQVEELAKKHGQAKLERDLGLKEGAARAWLRRGMKPRPKVRAKLLDLYGVPLEAWGETAKAFVPTPAAPPAAPTPHEPVKEGDLTAVALEVLGVLRAKLLQATGERQAATLATATATMARLVAKITANTQITEAAILRSEAWRGIEARIERVLKKHPGAAADWVREFEAIGSEAA